MVCRRLWVCSSVSQKREQKENEPTSESFGVNLSVCSKHLVLRNQGGHIYLLLVLKRQNHKNALRGPVSKEDWGVWSRDVSQGLGCRR